MRCHRVRVTQLSMFVQRRRTRANAIMHRSIKSRRGITAVLAMMYLGLFSVLALGFFASVSTSGQIAGNDMRSVSARLAAESGMQFIKYHLDDMDIPKETRPAQILSATFNALAARLNNEP